MAASGRTRLRLDDFDVKEVIARGSFGVVYRAVRKVDARVFALKQVSLHGMKKVDREEAIDEARLLAQVSHPYIIKHYDSFIDEDQKLNIVMEYAPNGNLNLLVKANKGKGLPNDLVWKYFIQALVGIKYLHSKKIIHRDIKTLNLFLDAKDSIKIGDLGIARALGDDSEFCHTIVGTPFYLSPELCEDKPYNEKSDVWALGIVLYELCMGGYPYTAQSEGALIRKILRGQYAPVTNRPPELAKVVELCLTFDYKKRPDTVQLLGMAVIKQKAQQLAIDLDPPPISTPVSDAPVLEAPARGQPQATPAGQQPSMEEMMKFIEANAPPQYVEQQNRGSMPNGPGAYQQQQAAAAFQDPRYRQSAPAQIPGYDPHPFALANQPAMQQVPIAAMQNMRISAADPRQRPASAQQQQQAYMPHHPAHASQLKEVIGGYGGVDQARQQQRPKPEALPPAGARQERPGSARAPYAQTGAQATISGYRSDIQQQEEQLWNVAYSAPQFGRKRNPELAYTGPSLRGSGGMNATAAGRWAPAAADDTTSYATSYYGPTTAYR